MTNKNSYKDLQSANDSNQPEVADHFSRRNFMKASGGAAALTLMTQTAQGTGRTKGQREPMFVPLDFNVPSALYDPVPRGNSTGAGKKSGRKKSIAFVIIHPTTSLLTLARTGFTDVVVAEELADRGYRALVADTEVTEGGYHVHNLLPNVGDAVGYLRDHSDVDTVILVGYSRGAHLMAFYQNVAENGIEVGQSDEVLFPAPDDVGGQPPADGILILDGVLGTGPGGGSQPEGLLEVDPRIANNEPQAQIPELNVYAPENGFDPETGEASYSDEFCGNMFNAQADRMAELIAVAEAKRERIESGQGDFPEDEPLVAVGFNSSIPTLDPSLMAETKNEWPLVTADGSIVEQNVPYVGEVPADDPAITLSDDSLQTTVNRFLSTNSIRTTGDYRITENSIEGLDYSSTNAEAPQNLETVSVPLLLLGLTGGRNYNIHSEIMMQHAGSSDKSLLYIEGAKHGFEPVSEEYGDTVARTFDAVDRWAQERFV